MISSKPADGTTETAPPYTPSCPVQGGKLQTSNSSVWSTYQEQILNSSPGIIKQLNEEPRNTKVTEGEQAKTERSRGKEAEETTLTSLAFIQEPRHNMGLGSIVGVDDWSINDFFNTQKSPLLHIITTLQSS